jgi:hypothetical protein
VVPAEELAQAVNHLVNHHLTGRPRERTILSDASSGFETCR